MNINKLLILEIIDLRIGRILAELLFKEINGDKEEYKEVKISSDLIIRKSCGCN